MCSLCHLTICFDIEMNRYMKHLLYILLANRFFSHNDIQLQLSCEYLSQIRDLLTYYYHHQVCVNILQLDKYSTCMYMYEIIGMLSNKGLSCQFFPHTSLLFISLDIVSVYLDCICY